MILNSCRKLYTFYLEVVHTINSLESLGRVYKGGKHKEYYFDRLYFYKRLLDTDTNSLIRNSNFPKVAKDLCVLKRSMRILEANKHDLIVYSTVENAGIAYGSNDLFFRYG